ncbi:MAG: T9SS type A sorting domain-containing protein, partial [Fluviicola sp.]|nr:T9SS type A sorting domain-containing protein [Fluviicola sp.]
PGQTAQIFSPSVNGSYAVQLTENGCVDTSACVVVTTVGVDENTFAETIKVYPNPNNGQFSIELADNSLVEITDILGKQVFKGNLQKGANQVNLSHIETGVYFVTIITGGKQVSVKIVKE